MAHYFFLFLVLHLAMLPQHKPVVKLPAAPNGIRLSENLYLDQTEIANLHWQEYLQALRQDSSEKAYRRALPDTTVWNAVDNSGVLTRTYLRAYKYRYHPVVGISFEQALAFNRWRSAVATKTYNTRYRKRLKRRGLGNYQVVFTWRLPTASEWEQAAAGGLNPDEHPYGVRRNVYKKYVFPEIIIYDSLGYRRPELAAVLRRQRRRHPVPGFNCLNTFSGSFRYGLHITNHIPFYLSPQRPVLFTRPNRLGFYDMIGNVAEMTAQKGIAKGGSWLHYLEQSQLRMHQVYERPAAWLGLRAVCEVSLQPVAPASPAKRS